MDQIIRENSGVITAGLFVSGLLIGLVLEAWANRLCRVCFPEGSASQSLPRNSMRFLTAIVTGVLFVAYFLAVFQAGAHSTLEVLPAHFWVYGRAVGHLVLISLLIAATVTDFRDYIIPDQITVPGMIIGIALATASGDTQLMHLWVDWNYAVPLLRGPYIPPWIAEHVHCHGFAWSVVGLLAGGGVTWLIRFVSSLLLGEESLGLGDATLMAMIGAFIGWQPLVFVFLLAPLCAILIGIAVRITTSRTYIPFGPYLSAAAVAVLLGWKWLWMLESSNEFSMRRLFGDAPGLLILAGISLTAFIVLLLALRLYRLIPGKARDDDTPSSDSDLSDTDHAS